MSQSYKTGASITPTVDTDRDVFGATGFKASYVDKSSGVATAIAGDFAEIMLTVAGNTSTANGISTAGQRMLTVADGTQFSDGDTIEDEHSNKYYVLSINANTLELKRPLVADVADASTVTQVGNTGLYSNTFSIATPGRYNIVISNPSVNMQNAIVPVHIEDEVMADAQTKLDNILTELGVVGSEVRFAAYL